MSVIWWAQFSFDCCSPGKAGSTRDYCKYHLWPRWRVRCSDTEGVFSACSDAAPKWGHFTARMYYYSSR